MSRVSLSDRIVEQITSLIARRVLKPGHRIPSEKQLCRQFGVGRTSVREALRSLSVMGLVQAHVGDGTFVAGNASRFVERTFQWGLLLDPKLVEDLIETRLMLESHTAFLAAGKASTADLAAAGEAIQGMEATVADPPRYLEHDLRFHLTIVRATQNSVLQNLLETTRGYLQSWIAETLGEAGEPRSLRRARTSVVEHKRILQALVRRDGEAARAAMAAHVLSSSAELKRHLAAGSDTAPVQRSGRASRAAPAAARSRGM